MGHWVEGLIAAGGPFAVFLGCFLEGETAAVLGGMIAHRGLASYPLIAALAFLGGFLADVMWFLLARHAPDRGLIGRLRARAAQSRFAARLHRNADAMTFAFRFLPGTRVLGPVLLAQTPMPALRFVLLNAAASALWAIVFTAIGWHFGRAAEGLFGRLAAHQWLIALAALTVAAVALHLWLSHRNRD